MSIFNKKFRLRVVHHNAEIPGQIDKKTEQKPSLKEDLRKLGAKIVELRAKVDKWEDKKIGPVLKNVKENANKALESSAETARSVWSGLSGVAKDVNAVYDRVSNYEELDGVKEFAVNAIDGGKRMASGALETLKNKSSKMASDYGVRRSFDDINPLGKTSKIIGSVGNFAEIQTVYNRLKKIQMPVKPSWYRYFSEQAGQYRRLEEERGALLKQLGVRTMVGATAKVKLEIDKVRSLANSVKGGVENYAKSFSSSEEAEYAFNQTRLGQALTQLAHLEESHGLEEEKRTSKNEAGVGNVGVGEMLSSLGLYQPPADKQAQVTKPPINDNNQKTSSVNARKNTSQESGLSKRDSNDELPPEGLLASDIQYLSEGTEIIVSGIKNSDGNGFSLGYNETLKVRFDEGKKVLVQNDGTVISIEAISESMENNKIQKINVANGDSVRKQTHEFLNKKTIGDTFYIGIAKPNSTEVMENIECKIPDGKNQNKNQAILEISYKSKSGGDKTTLTYSEFSKLVMTGRIRLDTGNKQKNGNSVSR